MAPRVVDREGKRHELIRAAAAIFAEQGFARARMADIADRAEVGKGTLYEYFPSKEELFFAVYEWTNSQIARRINSAAADGASPLDQLKAIMAESAAVMEDIRELYSLNLDFWASCRGGAFEGRFKAAIEGLYRGYRELAVAIMRRGQECGQFRRDLDVEGLSAMLVGAFDGLGIQHWIDETINPERCAESLARVLANGLGGCD